jgi:hypothetical protein
MHLAAQPTVKHCDHSFEGNSSQAPALCTSVAYCMRDSLCRAYYYCTAQCALTHTRLNGNSLLLLLLSLLCLLQTVGLGVIILLDCLTLMLATWLVSVYTFRVQCVMHACAQALFFQHYQQVLVPL